MRKIRNTKGFTLIELMIVVVIIGILAVIALPRFTRLGDDAKTKEADALLKQVATLQETYRVKCGGYVTTLTAADTDDCTALDDVGFEDPTLQFYQNDAAGGINVIDNGTTFTVTITKNPNETSLSDRVYNSADGTIKDAP